jgi:hypothetical protein
MFIQYAVAVCHDILRMAIDVVDRIPAPALGVILIALGVCVYESLGNSRIAPGSWR